MPDMKTLTLGVSVWTSDNGKADTARLDKLERLARGGCRGLSESWGEIVIYDIVEDDWSSISKGNSLRDAIDAVKE
jgi:hypothetical protein